MPMQGRRPTKVLAVFEEGKPPVPCKYKIKDRYGQEETVAIHKITSMDANAVLFASYECETYYGDVVQRYELRYWKQEFCWELFAK